MTIESILAVSAQGANVSELSASANQQAATTAAMPSSSDFSSWMTKQLDEVNQQILTSEVQVRQLASGQSDNLHQVMTSVTKAKTSFELVLQVRNKLLEGYQEIMRMQV